MLFLTDFDGRVGAVEGVLAGRRRPEQTPVGQCFRRCGSCWLLGQGPTRNRGRTRDPSALQPSETGEQIENHPVRRAVDGSSTFNSRISPGTIATSSKMTSDWAASPADASRMWQVPTPSRDPTTSARSVPQTDSVAASEGQSTWTSSVPTKTGSATEWPAAGDQKNAQRKHPTARQYRTCSRQLAFRFVDVGVYFCDLRV